jgi:uncharacterized surface protein with fasciclin (FAS1) repeats
MKKSSFFNRQLVVATAFAALAVPVSLSADHHGGAKKAVDAVAGSAEKAGEYAKPTMNIVETAVAAGQFNTLASLLTSAGLVETLQGDGPFTVFAPTDEAFAKVPKATLDALGKDPDALKSVLLYHVVDGKVMAEKVVTLESAKTLQGGSVSVSASDAGVSINNAKVTKADVKASNGVIHVIDTVLIPTDIVDIASSNADFSTLTSLLTSAGLVETLQSEGPFTVFAPTNAAFAKVPKATMDALAADPALLKKVLTYHVVSGRVTAGDVVKLTSAKSVQGEDIKIAAGAQGVTVNNAKVTKTDIKGSNGIIHVIDTVILPPSIGS